MDHLRSAKRSRTIRAVCEAIEPRVCLSVTFASPAPTLLNDIQGPIIASQFDSNSNFADQFETFCFRLGVGETVEQMSW